MYQETIDLSHLPPEGLTVERRIHPNAWKISEKDWSTRGDLVFKVFLRGGPDKTIVKGELEASITANCHRCLAAVPLDLQRRFHLTYLAPDRERFSREEVELTDTELEVAYLEQPFLPLHQLVAEQVYLAVPMKVLCQAACRGLCVHCGADLNQVECQCPQEQIDPRWAKLKSIVTNKSDQ